MTNLCQKLKKYYQKKGNKIVFINGMTLNQLALEMWEKLDYQGIDVGVVSRVLHGERLFTLQQLQIFCQVLKINPREEQELEYALISDILKKHRLDLPLNLNKLHLEFDINYLNRLVHIISSLRKAGYPHFVVDLSSFFEKFLISDFNYYKQILAKLYNEKSRAQGEISSPNKVLSLMKDLNDKAIAVGEELKDQGILSMGYMNVGGAYYVAKDWRYSAEFLENHYEKVDQNTKIEFLRTLFLDYAYQNDYLNFKKTALRSFKLLDKIDSNQNDVIVSLMEAFTRSLSKFGFTKEARNILSKINSTKINPFFKSQIIRGQVMTYCDEKKKEGKIAKDELIKTASEIFQEKYLPYKRHKQQIISALKKLQVAYEYH